MKDRREYMKNYRQNYGEKMKEQIQKWFLDHPGYRKKYCSDWRKSRKKEHDAHRRSAQCRNRDEYNRYMRELVGNVKQKKSK